MPGRDLSAELFGAKQESGRDLSVELFAAPASAPKAEPLTRTDKYLRGLKDPIDAGAQALTHMLPQSLVSAVNGANNWLADKTGLVDRLPEGGVDQQVRQDVGNYEARRAAQGESGFDGYRVLGNVVNPASVGIARALPAAATLAGRVGIGALGGAVSGGLTPVAQGDFGTEKAKQVALGAAVGGVIPALTSAAARIIRPNASVNPNLQILKDEGVRPTIGQALGGGWNRAEEKLASVPVIGDAISAARKRSLEDFNKAAINRASSKVGAEVQEIGQDGVKTAGDAISKAYDDALGQISGVRLDGQFNQNLMQLRGMAQGLTDSMKNKFNDTVNNVLLRKVSRTGSILPDDYKAIDSELGQLASRYGKSQVASEQEMGDAVKQLQSLLQQQMMRTNPHVADKLAAADEAWANLVRVEGAARAGQNAEGIFTPAQLNQAIRTADDSVRKRAVSRGTALMQDLGKAGQSVLGNKVPNSGTADRAWLGAGALGGGAAISPAIPAALLGGAALYTSPAQKALVSALTSRPAAAQQAAEVLRQITPYLLPASGQVATGLLNN